MASKKNKTSFWKTLLISLVALVIGVGLGFVLSESFLSYKVNFHLLGDEEQSVMIETPYKDAGFVCVVDGVNLQDKVVVTYYDINGNEISGITTTTLTSYVVKYTLKTENISTSITRIVNIVQFEDLEIHFMMLGNKYNGDSVYIKAGDTDILVDAGSRASSATAIVNYLDQHVTDDKLEYVIATHADQDHIAAFPNIFKEYAVDTVIDFPLTGKIKKPTEVYTNYRNAVNDLKEKGTKHYTALECYNNENGAQRVIELAAGIELEILYNLYYEEESSDENEYSVCFMLRRDDDSFLFTGDLEKYGEEYLVKKNELEEVFLFKAAHHGSKTSNTTTLLNVIKPKVVVCSCTAFYNEYKANPENVFPTAQAIKNFVAVGVEHFYVTSMVSDNKEGYEAANGNIVVYANNSSDTPYVECSNSNEDFYNFDIFKANRTWA